MNTLSSPKRLLLIAALACFTALRAHAVDLITNGGFEAGLMGWNVADQIGSDGTFYLQSGTSSPVNGFTVPPPPQGTYAAMTDAQAGGTHVLFQDFFVPAGDAFSLEFSLFVNNELAPDFYTPDTLDWATPALNQRARVDLMTSTSDPFSIDPADVLMNVFETMPGSPLLFGYNAFKVDVTSALSAYEGMTVRLRFTDVDNVAPMNVGVDDVRLATVPDAPSWIVTILTLAGMLLAGTRRTKALQG